ncbi:MAG: SRPBCC family protein [Bacteroidota bacterium]
MNTKITKEFEIDQPIGTVWTSLSNPEDVVTCVPGASITEKIDDKNYKGQVVTRFGPVKATYNGDIEIVELDEANHTMRLKGKGLDSKGKGSADMIMVGTLSPEGEGTKVHFDMDITIVGTLAQFGSRLINDVSQQLIGQFVESFRDKLTAENAGTAEGVEGGESTSAEATAENATPPKEDNALDASSLVGTVLKSLLNSVLDFFKSLFGGGKKQNP